MRTTLTLDPDVAVQLDRIRRRRGVPMKRVVNETLRAGLRQLDEPAPSAPYRMRPVSLGGFRLGSIDDIAEALAIAEGDDHR
jgi:hypothetical protein